MAVVPSFVPTPAYDDRPTPHERPYFLFAGRVEHLKGLEDVLPLFATDQGADLVIAGSGRAEQELRRATAGCRNVRWLGFVPRRDLGRWYQHALASIMPSATYETFGIVVIESLSHGTPVLARARGPLPELIARGGGLLFDDASGLASAVAALVSNPSLRESLSADARRSFREHWSEDAVVPQFLDLVERTRGGVRGTTRALAQAGRSA
jgi:glycosyltransferase involved in cell wall biosynthesis